jgi:hypothetical protein
MVIYKDIVKYEHSVITEPIPFHVINNMNRYSTILDLTLFVE